MNTLGSSLLDVHTEQTVFPELRVWSKNGPRWQQHVLRRLVLNGELTDEDVEELTIICQDEKAAFAPITDAEIASEAASKEAIALLCIENPTGINAYLSNGGVLEHAQSMAAPESPRTTKLYDRTQERLTQD
jgi:hypothetical protein